MHDLGLVCCENVADLLISVCVDLDAVHNLEAGLLAHRLDLGNELAHEAFLNKLRREMLVHDDGDAIVGQRLEALDLLDLNEKVLLRKFGLFTVQCDGDGSLRLEFLRGLARVKLVHGLDDSAFHLLREVPADRRKIRLDRAARVLAQVVLHFHALDVQLVEDDLPIVFRDLKRRVDVHLADRLAVLDAARVADRAAENDDFEQVIHVLLELLVDHVLIRRRIAAEVDRLRCIFVDRADEVLVDFLCHKRDRRCRKPAQCREAGVERLIGVDLVLLHAGCPESRAASADVPVGHVVDELLHRLAGLCDLVVAIVRIDFLDRAV